MKSAIRTVESKKVLASWRARGFSGGVWVDPPGQVWEDYVHDEDELFLVIEGDVELEMRGEKLRPAPGVEVLIPRGVRHTVRNKGGTVSRWVYAYGHA